MSRDIHALEKSIRHNAENVRRLEKILEEGSAVEHGYRDEDEVQELINLHSRWLGEDEDALDDLVIAELS